MLWWLTHPKELFAIDLRTLALFRVVVAGLILADLAIRVGDLAAFHSDHGVLPRSLVMEQLYPWKASLHLWSGEPFFQALLFMVAALFALGLLIGYRTRLCMVASWVLLLSLQNRNQVILQNSDVLLVCLCFWAMFLPLGARWSVDAALATNRDDRPVRVTTPATVAILLQALYVYVIGALLKDHSIWHDGLAVDAAVHAESYATLLGHAMRDFPTINRVLTYLVYYLELCAPVLLFLPVLFLPVRLLALLALVLMHLGFALALGIGLFPYVSIASLILYLPSAFWDCLGGRLQCPASRNITLYYDEPCGFCKKTCLLLREFLLPESVSITPAQSRKAIHRLMEKHHSWVVEDADGKHHLRWEAVVFVLRQSPLFGWLARPASLPWLMRLGDRFYGWVGDHRREASPFTERFLPYGRLKLRPSLLPQLVVTALMVLVGVVNLHSVWPERFPLSVQLNPILYGLKLDQTWNMFAPYPLSSGGWPVMRGKTQDGVLVDAWTLRMEPPSDVPPFPMSSWYKNYRWRKYFDNLYRGGGKSYARRYLEHYVCERWNDASAKRPKLASVQIDWMRVKTYQRGESRQIERVAFPEYSCP